MKTKEYRLDQTENLMLLFGTGDNHLKLIEEELDVKITTRGESVLISGNEDAITSAEHVIQALQQAVKKGITIGTRDVTIAIQMEKHVRLNILLNCIRKKLRKTAEANPSG